MATRTIGSVETKVGASTRSIRSAETKVGDFYVWMAAAIALFAFTALRPRTGCSYLPGHLSAHRSSTSILRYLPPGRSSWSRNPILPPTEV